MGPLVKPTAASDSVADAASFDLLPVELAADLERSLATAIDTGVVFPTEPRPLAIFRAAVAQSFRDIENHPKGRLLSRFLRDGPYEGEGPLPPELADRRVSDDEAAVAVGFVYAFTVNTLKGLLAELLAAEPVARIVLDLHHRGWLPAAARLYAGDAVLLRASSSTGWAKGADLHLLDLGSDPADQRVHLHGVAEVKSYPLPRRGLLRQLQSHVKRAGRGLLVGDRVFEAIEPVPLQPAGDLLRIEIATEGWTLPRHFRLDGERLYLPPLDVPVPENHIEEVTPSHWRVTLRWSQEALAAATLDMTFWYMGKIGEVHYAEPEPGWEEMTPAQAGRNAAVMMLYYALLRAPAGSLFERQAIALYNAYGFGYALGMNFIGPGRRRRMLWVEDLREIERTGRTSDGARIRGYHRSARS